MEVNGCDPSKLGLCYLLIFWKDIQRALGNIFNTSRQSWVLVLLVSLTSSLIWGSHFYFLGLNLFIGEMKGLDPAKITAYFPPSALSLPLLRQKAGAISWATSINSTVNDGQPNLGSLQSSLTKRTAIFALPHQLLLSLVFEIIYFCSNKYGVHVCLWDHSWVI